MSFFRSVAPALGIALVLRLLVALLVSPELIVDQADYHQLASRIASGSGYVNSVGNPTAYRPVGYPAFMGFLYWLLGAKPIVVRLFQALLSTFSLAALAYIAKFYGGDGALKRALWIGAFYPLDLLYVGALYPEILFIAFLWALLLLLLPWLTEAPQKNSAHWLRLVGVGVVAGFAAFAKAYGIALLPLLFIAVPFRRNNWKPVVRDFILAAVVMLGVIVPWGIRTHVRTGEFALTTNGGANLWIGNNGAASGGYSWVDMTMPLPSNEHESNEILFRSAIAEIKADPVAALTRVPLKWAYLLRSDMGILVEYFGVEPGETFRDSQARVPLWLKLIVWFAHAVVFIGGFSAWFFAPRGRWRVWCGWFFVFQLAMIAVFFGMPRFQMALVPFAILGTALLPTDKREFSRPSIPFLLLWLMGLLFLVAVLMVEASTFL